MPSRNLYIVFFSLTLLTAGTFKTYAQDISGEQVFVCAQTLTFLKFNSPVSASRFGDDGKNYTSLVFENTISIKTIADTAAPTTLYVTEGKRKHYFKIVFLADVEDPEKVKHEYDFSNLKYLKKLVDMESKNAENESIVSNNQSNTPPAPIRQEDDEEMKNIKAEDDSIKLAQAKINYDQQIKDQQEKMEQAVKEAELAKAEAAKQIAAAKEEMLRQQKEQEESLAKAKQQAEEAQRLEEQRLLKEKQQAEEAQKAESERLAKQKQQAEDAQKAESERLAKQKQQAEDAQKQEALRLAKIKADSAARAESEILTKRRVDSITAQKAENERRSKIAIDSINRMKAENARITQAHLDSIAAQRKRNDSLTKVRLDSIANKKIMDQIAAKAKADTIVARKKREADSIAALPKFYTRLELWQKYPQFVWGDPPWGQYLAGDYFLEYDTLENSRVGNIILKDTTSPNLNVTSDTMNGASVTLQSINFSGINCYMRLAIRNKSNADYLVGQINLQWIQSMGRTYKLHPCFITASPSYGFITSFPVLAPGVERIIVLTTRAVNVRDNDMLLLSIGDRLDNIDLQLSVPGKLYNEQMAIARHL